MPPQEWFSLAKNDYILQSPQPHYCCYPSLLQGEQFIPMQTPKESNATDPTKPLVLPLFSH